MALRMNQEPRRPIIRRAQLKEADRMLVHSFTLTFRVMYVGPFQVQNKPIISYYMCILKFGCEPKLFALNSIASN